MRRSASSVTSRPTPEPDVSEHFRRSLSGKWPRRQTNYVHYTPPFQNDTDKKVPGIIWFEQMSIVFIVLFTLFAYYSCLFDLYLLPFRIHHLISNKFRWQTQITKEQNSFQGLYCIVRTVSRIVCDKRLHAVRALLSIS